MDYDYWAKYLSQGRRGAKTQDRPIGSSKTKRVVRLLNGDIALRLHSTYCVVFHANGEVTYDTGGWNTVTTMRFINEHGPVRVWREQWKLHLRTIAPIGHTVPRVSKCRQCHGATVLPSSCYGPSWCYTYSWHGRTCEHGNDSSHRMEQCRHGESDGHKLPDVECYRCKGTGSVDYGSKPIYPEWTGSAYRFHPGSPGDGQYVSDVTYLPHTVGSASGESYSNSGVVLAGVMPDIDTEVKAPCECETLGNRRVRDVIVHLNDIHAWTREAIADWLDTLDLDLRFPVPE